MRARDSNDPINEVKDQKYWYHYHLFRDPNFQREASKLIAHLKRKYPGLPGYDVEWLEMAGADKSDIEEITRIAAEYQTHPEQVMRYATGFYKEGMPINPAGVSGSVEDGWIVMRFSPRITQKQYENYWKMVMILKRDLGYDPFNRVRGAKNTELIYWIQRARHKGLKFSEIFDRYKRGELLSYSGDISQFDTAKELENYFHQYKFI